MSCIVAMTMQGVAAPPASTPTVLSYGTGSGGSGTSLIVSMASGVTAGNLLILVTAQWGTYAGGGLSGWTLVHNNSVSGADGTTVYSKVAVGGEGSLSLTGFGTSADTRSAMVLRIGGHNGINAHNSGRTPVPATTHTSLAVTPTVDNCLILRILANQSAGDSTPSYQWSGSPPLVATAIGNTINTYTEHISVVSTPAPAANVSTGTLNASAEGLSIPYAASTLAIAPAA
jgi:hypothetical protein